MINEFEPVTMEISDLLEQWGAKINRTFKRDNHRGKKQSEPDNQADPGPSDRFRFKQLTPVCSPSVQGKSHGISQLCQ